MVYYDWRKLEAFPRKNLEGWYQYVPAETGNTVIYDDSGNARTLNSSLSNSTYLQTNVINGQPALRLTGFQDPLKYVGNVPVRHIFVVASFDNATFAGNEGLVTDAATNGFLVGAGTGTNKFFDFDPQIVVSSYRKNGVSYPKTNMLAPMSNQIGIIEMKLSSTMVLDSLQIGRDRNDNTRRWTGFFVEMLVFSAEKNENELRRIYEYFATRYWLWRKNDTGLNIFPFVADRSRSVERDQESYISQPYSGPKKALVYDLQRKFQLPFSVRHQAEYDAAEAFHAQHSRTIDFIYEDHKYIPFRNRTMNFTTGIKDDGSNVSYRFNYSFEAEESV